MDVSFINQQFDLYVTNYQINCLTVVFDSQINPCYFKQERPTSIFH